MKRLHKFALMALLALCSLTVSAQNFQYETINEKAILKRYDKDYKHTIYLTNTINIQLPTSCDNAKGNANINTIRTQLLKKLFGDNYYRFSSPALIRKNVKSEFYGNSGTWQVCASIPRNADDYSESEIAKAEIAGVYKGIIFFKIYTGKQTVGTAYFETIGFGIDISTGSIASANDLFSLSGQKEILNILTSQNNIKKYIKNDQYTMQEYRDVVSDIKQLVRGNQFPSFYIASNGNMHLLFAMDDLCNSIGEAEFIIPMSDIEGSANSGADYIGNADDGEIYEIAEQQPTFPGGMEKLMEWLSKNLRYPKTAESNGIQGRVICQFIVNKDGSISEPKVIKSIDSELDAEAIRVLHTMPKWIPGRVRGEVVRVRYTLPVTFRLH